MPTKTPTRAETPTRVLFLDDMVWRHKAFKQAVGLRDDVEIWQAWSAAGAIKMLSEHWFDQVFLDHDLSEDDIMVEMGAASTVPTGMDVVEFILTLSKPPGAIVVHSCNTPAAAEMVRRLSNLRDVSVRGISFPDLLRRLY